MTGTRTFREWLDHARANAETTRATNEAVREKLRRNLEAHEEDGHHLCSVCSHMLEQITAAAIAMGGACVKRDVLDDVIEAWEARNEDTRAGRV